MNMNDFSASFIQHVFPYLNIQWTNSIQYVLFLVQNTIIDSYKQITKHFSFATFFPLFYYFLIIYFFGEVDEENSCGFSWYSLPNLKRTVKWDFLVWSTTKIFFLRVCHPLPKYLWGVPVRYTPVRLFFHPNLHQVLEIII